MRAPALAALLVLAAALAPLATPAAPELWRAKADPALLQAFDAGRGWLDLVLRGPPVAAPAEPLPDRAAWSTHWRAASGPFLAEAAAHVHALGGDVLADVPAIAALAARVPRAALPVLLAREDVAGASSDAPDAVRLLPQEEAPGALAPLREALDLIEVPLVWGAGYRGAGIAVAVLDTGARPTHETLRAADGTSRIGAWHDATGTCATPCDDHGHGTRAASILAGSSLFQATAPDGAAPRTTLLVAKFLDAHGSGSFAGAMAATQWAFDQGAEVLSGSFGGPCTGAAIDYGHLLGALADAGMASVFAAGASGPSPGSVPCPAAVEKVLSVGAVGFDEAPPSWTSLGPCTWLGVTRTCPDVVAVGGPIEAASHLCDTCYSTQTGSSWAAPQVAGALALLEQAALVDPGIDLSPAEGKALLKATAKDLGPPGWDNTTGAGLVKAHRAYSTLVGAPAGNLSVGFSIQRAETRAYETNELRLALANLGAAPLQGHVTFRAAQVDTGACPPACEVLGIADQPLALGAFGDASFRHVFQGSAHAAGTWSVTAAYDYTYTDPEDGETKSGHAERAGTFMLTKVSWAKARDGVPPLAPPGQVLGVALGLVNTGNEDASNVRVTEAFVPRGHLPLVRAPAEASAEGLFADPAPDTVAFERLDEAAYAWTVGDLAVGQGWSAQYTVLAALPGSYRFLALITYEDETGRTLTDVLAQGADVG